MAQNLLVRGMNDMTLDAREDRLINEVLTAGLFEPGDELKVVQQASANMTVRVGSGTSGDRMVASGDGGVYIVRNPDTYIGSGNADVSIANGDATFDRIDGIDLIVYDDSIDSSGFSKAEVIVTPGTPASSPVAPAVPTAFAAVIRLGTILVEQGESTSIVTGDITDTRVASDVWTKPRGLVGLVELTNADQTGITTEVDVTGLALTVPTVIGRRYKITYGLSWYSQTSGNIPAFKIHKDGGTYRTHQGGPNTAQGTSAYATRMPDTSEFDVGDGNSHTYQIRVYRFDPAAGSVAIQKASGHPAKLWIEDVGGYLP
jgi:hypothetical protein